MSDGVIVPGDPETSARRFAGNAGWLLAAEAASKVASFAFVVVVARGLGATAYGTFTFAVSFVPLFLSLSGLNVQVELVRDVARDPGLLSRSFASGFLVRVALGVIAVTVAVALSPLLVERAAQVGVVAILGTALLLDEIAGYVGTVFKAFERMRFSALALLANRILTTALAIGAVALGAGLVAVTVAYLVGSAAALAVAWVLLRRRFPPVSLRDADASLIRHLIREGAGPGLASFVNMAVFRIDAVMLQAIRGTVEVARYGIAYRFLESFLFVAWALGSAALPRFARGARAEAGTRTFTRTLALAIAFYLPIAVGAPFAARFVVVALFTDRYAEATPAVTWLTGAGVFYAVAYLSRMACLGAGRRASVAWIALATLGANVIANAVVIPRHGFVGAAVVTFFTEVLEALLLGGLFLRTYPAPRRLGVVAAPIVASAAMGAVLWGFGIHGLAAIGVGAAVFAAALFLSARIMAPAEARTVLRVLHRRRAPRGIVLAYHAVGSCPAADDRTSMFVSRDAFEEQMAYLARARQVVPLSAILSGDVPPGPPSVAITFDDAYRNVLTEALPILERHGFPATVFAPTGWLGRTTEWAGSSSCDFTVMDEHDLREAERRGLSVESHGSRHRSMAAASFEEARDDLEASVADLERVLGRRPLFLAWPFGPSSSDARRAAASLGFQGAFSIDALHDGRFAWERVPVTRQDGLRVFAIKTGGRYLRLRHGRVGRFGYRVFRPLVTRGRWNRP